MNVRIGIRGGNTTRYYNGSIAQLNLKGYCGSVQYLGHFQHDGTVACTYTPSQTYLKAMCQTAANVDPGMTFT